MDKKRLRKDFKERRMRLDPLSVATSQMKLLERLQECSLPLIAVVHRYVPNPLGGEPDPAPLARWLKGVHPGLVEALPRVAEEGFEMRSIVLEESARLVPNRWGIPEPAIGDEIDPDSIDLVMVPLLAFDIKGQRVGYGKGYYDRFLKRCRRDCLKMGLSFFDPVERIDDTDEWDVSLDICLTPERVYEFH